MVDRRAHTGLCLGVGQNGDGETAPRAPKSTRIDAEIDGDRKLVHANFAAASMDDD